jgi:hypothetical protein
MALRSPTQIHSFWGAFATAGLPASAAVEVGDTAFDTTLGTLVVCTAVGPVVWSAVGGGVAGFDLSFQGENTGTSPLVIGSVYLPATTLTVASRVLLGVVGAGTATLRLVEQATSTVVATWTQTGALTDVPLAAPTAALPAGWYVFDLAGSAAGTVTRCYGAHLE